MSQAGSSSIPKHATKVFSGVIFDIYQWQQKLYDGSFATFEKAKMADGASVIAIKDDKIIMLEEEQPLRPKHWTTPQGSREPGDASMLDTAKRELYEETGMVFDNYKLVMVEDIGNSKLEWRSFRYIATNFIRQDETKRDAGERIRVFELPFEKAKSLAAGNPYACEHIFDQVTSVQNLLDLPSINTVQ